MRANHTRGLRGKGAWRSAGGWAVWAAARPPLPRNSNGSRSARHECGQSTLGRHPTKLRACRRSPSCCCQNPKWCTSPRGVAHTGNNDRWRWSPATRRSWSPPRTPSPAPATAPTAQPCSAGPTALLACLLHHQRHQAPIGHDAECNRTGSPNSACTSRRQVVLLNCSPTTSGLASGDTPPTLVATRHGRSRESDRCGDGGLAQRTYHTLKDPINRASPTRRRPGRRGSAVELASCT